MNKENNNMPNYSYKDIANYFIKKHKKDNEPITPMQLQKLVYFANGIYLALYNKPLIKEKFEAWRYGVVVNQLFQDLKSYGGNGVVNTIQTNNSSLKFTEDSDKILN